MEERSSDRPQPRKGAKQPGRRASSSTDGAGKAPSFGKQELLRIREQLLERRSYLARQQVTQLRALHDPDKHHLADLEEMAADSSETDSVCAIVDLGSSTIDQIDAALEKIAAGTYGVCERCREAIHPERLEALPFVSLCVGCQRRKEEREATHGRGAEPEEETE